MRAAQRKAMLEDGKCPRCNGKADVEPGRCSCKPCRLFMRACAKAARAGQTRKPWRRPKPVPPPCSINVWQIESKEVLALEAAIAAVDLEAS